MRSSSSSSASARAPSGLAAVDEQCRRVESRAGSGEAFGVGSPILRAPQLRTPAPRRGRSEVVDARAFARVDCTIYPQDSALFVWRCRECGHELSRNGAGLRYPNRQDPDEGHQSGHPRVARRAVGRPRRGREDRDQAAGAGALERLAHAALQDSRGLAGPEHVGAGGAHGGARRRDEAASGALADRHGPRQHARRMHAAAAGGPDGDEPRRPLRVRLRRRRDRRAPRPGLGVRRGVRRGHRRGQEVAPAQPDGRGGGRVHLHHHLRAERNLEEVHGRTQITHGSRGERDIS